MRIGLSSCGSSAATRMLARVRQIELAKSEVQSALSQFAAALLRTMAGNDTEVVYLIRRLARVVEAINNFEKQADGGMSAAELQEVLRLPQAEMDYSDDDWCHRLALRTWDGCNCQRSAPARSAQGPWRRASFRRDAFRKGNRAGH